MLEDKATPWINEWLCVSQHKSFAWTANTLQVTSYLLLMDNMKQTKQRTRQTNKNTGQLSIAAAPWWRRRKGCGVSVQKEDFKKSYFPAPKDCVRSCNLWNIAFLGSVFWGLLQIVFKPQNGTGLTPPHPCNYAETGRWTRQGGDKCLHSLLCNLMEPVQCIVWTSLGVDSCGAHLWCSTHLWCSKNIHNTKNGILCMWFYVWNQLFHGGMFPGITFKKKYFGTN